MIAGVAVAAGLVAGSTGVAMAQESGTPPPPPREICDRQDEIQARVAQAEARYEQLHQRLVDAQARAAEAGRNELVARLDQALTRLEQHHGRVSARVAERLERLATYCAETPGVGDAAS
jgi:hypothetical protein